MRHFRRVFAIAMADKGRRGRMHEGMPLGLAQRAGIRRAERA